METDTVTGSASHESAFLKICRVCLATECKLYPLELTLYRQLLGDDYMPAGRGGRQCGTCARRLTLCAQLRERAIHAQRVLGEYGPLTNESLKSITSLNKNITDTLTTKHFKANHADLEINFDMKVEYLDDTIFDTSETETKRNEPIEMFLDENSYDDNRMVSDSSDMDVKVTTTKLLTEHNCSNNGMDEDTSSCDIPIKELKEAKLKKKSPGKKAVKTKKSVKEPKSKAKSDEPKVDRRRKPFLSENLNETMFLITDMTPEEQIEHVRKRQETDNYKNSTYKCTLCFKGFLDDEAFKAHMSRHTNACGEHECDVCRIHFRSRNALRKHYTAHHTQRFDCTICSYTTIHRQSARLHERWHKGTVYTCSHCGEMFNKFTTYMGHVRIKHPSRYVCQLCGFSFVSDKGIQLHKKLKHRLDDTTVPVDGPQCSECGVRFSSDSALSTHRRVAATCLEPNTPQPKRTRRNVKTNYGFGDDGTQKINSRNRKTDSPISCEQCGVVVENYRGYHAHFRRQHPDKNRTDYSSMRSPAMCELCGKMFQSYALLKDHTWLHTNEKPFKCEVCDKSFRMKQRLVTHRRLHSESRTSYPCHVCGKELSSQNNRNRHMTIHTGLKPFRCEMCNKHFKTVSEKRMHVSYVHLKKPWPKRNRSRRVLARDSAPTESETATRESETATQQHTTWPEHEPKMPEDAAIAQKNAYYNG